MVEALMVTSSFLPGRGGIESYLAELCSSLAPRLAVLAPPKRDGKTLPRDLPYPVHALPGLPAPGRRTLRSIVDTARREKVERILFGTPWPLALLGPSLVRRGLRYAVIVHGAEFLVPAAVPGLRSYLAHSLAGAELLLPVSDFTAQRLGALVGDRGSGRIERLRARVDPERFHPTVDGRTIRQRLGIPPGVKVILCFGRLVPRKGVDRLIEALPQVTQKVPGTTLVIAGTGPEESELKKLAAKRAGRVIFAGRVPEADAPAFYAAADVFALPVADRWFGLEIEGLGVVLLEAAATGTPCVTGRSGGTPEAVIDGVTGLVVEATRHEDLVNALVRILEDDDLARAMGRAGREHVRSSFSTAIEPQALLEWLA